MDHDTRQQAHRLAHTAIATVLDALYTRQPDGRWTPRHDTIDSDVIDQLVDDAIGPPPHAAAEPDNVVTVDVTTPPAVHHYSDVTNRRPAILDPVARATSYQTPAPHQHQIHTTPYAVNWVTHNQRTIEF